MPTNSRKLRAELRAAGISDRAIDAAWPSWWSAEAEGSPSASAELRFTLSRRLGLSAKSLVGERVEFVWGDDHARFKHLLHEGKAERAALTSFAMIVGRLLTQAWPEQPPAHAFSASELRKAILQRNHFVDLGSLVSMCWSVGVPVVQLRVFPLEAKGMHAMVVKSGDRHAVLIARDASYPALTAFTLAHELGHIFLGHLPAATVLVDAEADEDSVTEDAEEHSSDRFALELLTGSAEPDIRIDDRKFNSAQLAHAVLTVADKYRIEPGTLALCVGYSRGIWPIAVHALGYIYGEPIDVPARINAIAKDHLQWDMLGDDAADYLSTILGIQA